MSIPTVDSLMARTFEKREPRSDAYKAGCRALFENKLNGVRMRCPYSEGSAERDAWYAGTDEAHLRLRDYVPALLRRQAGHVQFGVLLLLIVVALLCAIAGCVTMPESQSVAVIGRQHPAPVGCQDLGPVGASIAGQLGTDGLVLGNPTDELVRMKVLTLGGDTLHYTGAFPLRGEAYKCRRGA